MKALARVYESAPATKLLATHCACCGRALVDAVSVERCIGPDCAERYGAPEAQGEPNWDRVMAVLDGIVAVADVNPMFTPREAANKLVFEVARKGVTRDFARPIFEALAALGFEVLADRIAKRFRTTVVVRRYGEAVFPIDVVTTFEDGSRRTERWDGVDRRRIYVYEGASRARTAQVDPNRILMLDVNYTNNSRTIRPRAASAATKWSLAWMGWLQDLLLTYASLV